MPCLGAKVKYIDDPHPVIDVNGTEMSVIPDPSHLIKLILNCFGEH